MKIEYKKIDSPNQMTIKELNDLGEEGWELASTVLTKIGFIYYFKRYKPKKMV